MIDVQMSRLRNKIDKDNALPLIRIVRGVGFTGSVTQSVFDFGALRHRQRAAEATLQQSAAQYRGVVLGAFQNAADTLYAIDADARTLAAADDAERAAARTLELTGKQQ